jgi:adenylate cyclase
MEGGINRGILRPVSAQLPEDLLDDVEGADRDARRFLLEWLLERGVTVDELRDAKREGRLALLPTEHVLTRGLSLSLDDAVRRSGLEREFVERVWRVAGIPVPEGEEPVVDDEDLEAMKVAKLALDAGMSDEGYVEISRIVGRAAGAIAEAIVETANEFARPDDSEAEFAIRLEEVTEQLMPVMPILVAFPIRQHVRQAIRHQALDQKEGGVAGLRGIRQLAIGFADVVGYSSLSEKGTVREASRVAEALEELAAAVAEPPVRLVKLIGDEAMFVCEEPDPLVAALLRLNELAQDRDNIPGLHLGVAMGEVVARAGDVYGPAVNHASRLTGASNGGQLLVSAEVAAEIGEGFELRELDPVELKGVGEVKPTEVLGHRRL